MKNTLKTIALAGALAGGITGLAPANTLSVVHIAGAPAYRQDSILVIDTVATAAGGHEIASTSTSYANASAVQWFIPNYTAGEDLLVNASFTGSTAGTESVGAGAQNSGALEQKFLPEPTTDAAAVTAAASPNNTGTLTISELHVPDFSLSDTFVATTPFNGTVTLRQGTTGTAHNTYTFASLTSSQLAIEPYEFVGTAGLAARGVTNITTAQAQLLYKNGKLPLSFFTGNHADTTSFVYPLSRDPGSGARFIALAETGVGVSTSIKTYKPAVSGATVDSAGNTVSGTISNTTTGTGTVTFYPAGVIASTQIYDANAGDTGYPKFGTTGTDQSGLLAAITSIPSANAATPSQALYFITYLNPTDAAEATAAGSEVLTYNGTPYSPAALADGLYSFWSYENLQAATLTGDPLSFANALIAKWPTTTLSSGVQISTVHVSRSIDGGPISGGL